MSTIIYWFSGTGNSLAVARRLATLLGDGTKVLPLAAAMDSPAGDADCIGIIYPVYAFGPPELVARFAAKLRARSGSYIFDIATCASMPGKSHGIMRDRLRQAGLELSAGWTLKMPGNCTWMKPPPEQAKQEKMFAGVERCLKVIADIVRNRRIAQIEDSIWPIRPLAGLIWPVAVRGFARDDKKFFATDACIHCGLCERICPVQNVKLVNGKPTWLHHCQGCLACLQWCPTAAIEFGKKTAGRARYHHPSAKASELCVLSKEGK